MRLAFVLFIFVAVSIIPAWTQSSDTQDENRPRPSRRPAVDGFIVCSGSEKSAPVYFSFCQNSPAGSVGCGEKVGVMTRNGDMLRVRLANGFPRYVPSSAISQRPDQMIPFGDDSGVPDRGSPDCAHPPEGNGMMPNRDAHWSCRGTDCPQPPERNVTPPRATYSPPPEFSEQARKQEITGTVLLSLTVGLDGIAHDIKVEKGIGYGLDEKAMEAVSRWKFEPALKDGQPIEKQIRVEVSFNLMK
jgi:TonB family protein